MRTANFVEETVASVADGGEGDLTLTGIPGRPRFSDVFPRPTVVQYVVENTSTGEFEVGLGVANGGTLSRHTTQTVWINFGGTWIYAHGNPLILPETPSPGDIKVRMAATAQSAPASNLLRWPGLSFVAPSGVLFDQVYPISPHLAVNSAGSAGLFLGQTEYYSAYLLQYPGVVNSIIFDIPTASPGGAVKSALYSIWADGTLGEKIVGFDEIDISTTGRKVAFAGYEDPYGTMLTPGYYAIGYIANTDFYQRCSLTGGVRTIYPRVGSGGYPDTGFIAGDFAVGMPQTLVESLNLPDPTSINGNGPWIGMEVN